MIEKHPFAAFIPKKVKYLLLGSFPGKQVEGNDWFYGTKRNQFWPILESVYKRELKTLEEKQQLLNEIDLAVTDIILTADRTNNSNLDMNLKNLVLNTKVISTILKKYKIIKIYFSSRFVENLYRRKFDNLIKKYPNVELITLPSPSPRYSKITKTEKVAKYESLLPKTTFS